MNPMKYLPYPLVNVNKKTMERSTIFHGENPLFLWPFPIAMLNYQRVKCWALKKNLGAAASKRGPSDHPRMPKQYRTAFHPTSTAGFSGAKAVIQQAGKR